MTDKPGTGPKREIKWLDMGENWEAGLDDLSRDYHYIASLQQGGKIVSAAACKTMADVKWAEGMLQLSGGTISVYELMEGTCD